MKTYIQPGDVITITAGATIASGDGVLVENMFGVAVHDAVNGDSLDLAVTGVFELPKTSAEAWAIGAAVYWDGSEASTTQGSGDVLIGVAAAVAANPSATGLVRLNGSFGA